LPKSATLAAVDAATAPTNAHHIGTAPCRTRPLGVLEVRTQRAEHGVLGSPLLE
jgi:hypothetical protein